MEEDSDMALMSKIDLKIEDVMIVEDFSKPPEEKKEIPDVDKKVAQKDTTVYVAVPFVNDLKFLKECYTIANEIEEKGNVSRTVTRIQKKPKRPIVKHPPSLELVEPIICDICEENFKNHIAFALHSINHSTDSKYSCHLCSYKNASKYHIEMHIRVHEGTTRYKCEICSKAFSISTHAIEHKYFHTGEKPFQCEICGKKFMFSWFLTSHRRTQHWELVTGKPLVKYDCHICQKHYTSSTGLKRHNVSHHGAKGTRNIALCEICGKTLSSKEKLKFHLRIHTGYKPHACTYCPKCFSKKEQLKEHLRVHTGERPYICKVCNKGFTQRSPLRIHERIHSGERPYICSECDKGFISKSAMDIHKRRCELAKALYENHNQMEIDAHKFSSIAQKKINDGTKVDDTFIQNDQKTFIILPIRNQQDTLEPISEKKENTCETNPLELKKIQNLESISLELYARAVEFKINGLKSDLIENFNLELDDVTLKPKFDLIDTKKIETEQLQMDNLNSQIVSSTQNKSEPDNTKENTSFTPKLQKEILIEPNLLIFK